MTTCDFAGAKMLAQLQPFQLWLKRAGEWILGRKVFWRGVALLISVLLLGGCETQRDGLDYSAISRKVGPPKAGHARTVVLRERLWRHRRWRLERSARWNADDRPQDRHLCLRRSSKRQAELGATEAAFPGVTRYEVTAQSGRTYFFVARTSKRKNAMMATAALPAADCWGWRWSTALTSGYDNPGPIDFFPLDETAARTTIVELKLAPGRTGRTSRYR